MEHHPPEDDLVDWADQFFLKRVRDHDADARASQDLVGLVRKDLGIRSVDDLAERSNRSKRALQRLFAEYVGVSPKWVIRLYRLHEAVERLSSGECVDGTQLALDLGYFDQSHLIRDFKALVGYTPWELHHLRESKRGRSRRRV